METEQELNKKLAEWAGFTKGQNYGWSYPDGDWFWRLPYFDESLDACFKWLVPKVINYLVGERTFDRLSAIDYLFERWQEEYAQCLDFSLALSKAIEKLIGDKDG